jgi:hypothetical protein
MVLITLAVAMYKKHQDAEKKNEEMKELAHNGNFTLPDKVPAIPENAEAGQHWRIGVDPAAKGAVHHDSDLQIVSEARRSTDSGTTNSSVDELWDEVASMVECPTPRQSDYFDVRTTDFKRGGTIVSSRSGLHRSQTGKMSIMSAASTDSWTSRYSCMTDGRRYSEDDGDDAMSVRWL